MEWFQTTDLAMFNWTDMKKWFLKKFFTEEYNTMPDWPDSGVFYWMSFGKRFGNHLQIIISLRKNRILKNRIWFPE